MQRQQQFTYQEFKDIYSRVPRLTVEVVVIINGGVVLLERQEESWQGLWHIPGGTVFYKEPLIDAVNRIAQEELGIEVTVQKLLGYIEYPSEEKERGFGWSVGIAFLCTTLSQINQAQWLEKGIKVFTQLPEKIVEEQKKLLNTVLPKMV